jgi:hypothetical protein
MRDMPIEEIKMKNLLKQIKLKITIKRCGCTFFEIDCNSKWGKVSRD